MESTIKEFDGDGGTLACRAVLDDFELVRVIGKGEAGKVVLARYRAEAELYALKIISKRYVLAHQELERRLTEHAVLKRMAREPQDPFVVRLHWSFHDKESLFLAIDFHPGGTLAAQLVSKGGRFGRDATRFYATEIVEGCEGLHAAGVIYRNLQPENILIGADGHIVLTNFGLSKVFTRKVNSQSLVAPPSLNVPIELVTPHWMHNIGSPGRVSGTKGRLDRDTMNRTICGPPKYLAPEIIQDLAYSYKVDWWSFGILLYEMSTGITPFWAENQSDMYARVLQDELQFPEDEGMDQDTKNLIRGLLQRNPALRTCEPRLKKHPYFSVIDWQRVYYKQYVPPYTPLVDPSNTGNAQNIGDACLDMVPFMANEAVHADSDSGFSWTASNSGPPECPTVEENAEIIDVFDGYSFEGHDSIIIDSDELEEGGGEIKDVEALDSEVRIGSTTTAEEMVPHQTHKLPEVEVPHAPMTKIKPIISFAKLKLPKLAASLASSTSHRVATARSKGNSWAVSGFYKALDLHKFPQDGAVQDIPSVEPRLANWIPTAPPRIRTEVKRKNTGVAALGRAFNIHPFDREYGNTINSTLYEQALTLEALNSLADGRMPDIDKDLGEEIDSSQPNTPEQLASSMFERLIEHGCNNLTPDINSSGFSEYAVAEGGFGDIWIGKFHDGTKLAIKVLRFNSTTDDTTRKQLKRSMREIYNWSKLEHENVHKLLGVIMFRGRLGMVSRWMEHGNLRQYLGQNHNADRYQLCAQIAKGVAYLHGVDMIHGDLKACNVLVASDGTIRLTDFDYSIISNCSLAFSATTRVGGGTLRWMAPELLVNEDSPEKNKKTDIYSLGMTFLETLTNAHPYCECQHDGQIYRKIWRKEHPVRSLDYFPDTLRGRQMWGLLVQCWDYDPACRPTASGTLASLLKYK